MRLWRKLWITRGTLFFAWGLLLGIPTITFPCSAEETEADVVTLDVSQGGSLQGAEARFSLDVEAGTYIHLVLDQGHHDDDGTLHFGAEDSVDLILELFDDQGGLVAKRDAAWGANRPETLHWISSMTGRYFVKVKNPKRSTSAAFRLRLEALREALPTDPLRVEADRRLAEGTAAYFRDRADAHEEALRILQEAEPFFVALEDPVAARSLARTAVLFASGIQQSEGLLRQKYCLWALRLWGESEPTDRVDDVRGTLAMIHWRAGEPQQAAVLWEANVEYREEAGGGRYAVALTNLAQAKQALGDLTGSYELHLQALEVWKATEHPDAAATLNSLGVLSRTLGDHHQALAYYRRALHINQVSEELGDREERIVKTLNNIAWSHYWLGNHEESRNTFRAAIRDAGKQGYTLLEATARNGLGRLEVETGNLEEGRQEVERAVSLARAAGNGSTLAAVLQTLGDLERLSERPQAARQALMEAWGHAETLNDSSRHAGLSIRLAQVEAELGDLVSAAKWGKKALSSLEQQRAGIPEPTLQFRYLASYRHFYEIHLGHLVRLGGGDPSLEILAEILQVAEKAHARSLVEAMADQSLGPLSGPDASDWQAQKDRIEREIERLSSERRRTLGHGAPKVAEAGFDSKLQALEGKLTGLRLRARQQHARERVRAEASLPTLSELQKAILQPGELLLHFTLGDEASWLLAVDSQRAEIHTLPSRTVLEPLATDWLGAVTSPLDRSLSYKERRQRESQAPVLGLQLSKHLLEPVRERLNQSKLLVVADGALHGIPFTALPRPESEERSLRKWSASMLLQQHEVVTLPSVAVANQLLARPESDYRRGLAMVWDDPVFRDDPRLSTAIRGLSSSTSLVDQSLVATRSAKVPSVVPHAAVRSTRGRNLPRLEGGRLEAEALQRHHPSVERYSGFEAHLGTLAGVEKASLLHFATHGISDPRHPESSGLFFAQFGHDQKPRDDALLTLRGVYDLNLGASLVVLSACETAVGEVIEGEGPISLARGFLHSGARRVIATRWRVDDAMTAELMVHFYEHLFEHERSPAEALRQAQIAMARKYPKQPVLWAGFTLQGDWR